MEQKRTQQEHNSQGLQDIQGWLGHLWDTKVTPTIQETVCISFFGCSSPSL